MIRQQLSGVYQDGSPCTKLIFRPSMSDARNVKEVGWRGGSGSGLGRQNKKKRSSQASCKSMGPGNSFPQICVVSVRSVVETPWIAQEYLRTVAFSNHRESARVIWISTTWLRSEERRVG